MRTICKRLRRGDDLLAELQKIAHEKQVKVNVCHVLRYTPFYKTIKTLIDKDVIGKIMTMELNEHVWIAHFLDSFVRGKWNSQKKCAGPSSGNSAGRQQTVLPHRKHGSPA